MRCLLLIITLLSSLSFIPAGDPAAAQDGVAVYFGSKGECAKAIMERIAKAEKTIQVQAYSFSSIEIARALVEARQRGVGVTVILDKEERKDKASCATLLRNAGVTTYFDTKHDKAHNKIVLIDGKTIITGSFNLIAAEGEDVADNIVIIDNKPDLSLAYVKQFAEHLSHSKQFERESD